MGIQFFSLFQLGACNLKNLNCILLKILVGSNRISPIRDSINDQYSKICCVLFWTVRRRGLNGKYKKSEIRNILFLVRGLPREVETRSRQPS